MKRSSCDSRQFIGGSDDRPVSRAKISLGQIAVALVDRIEAGLRTQDGKPRRPDVRRDQIAALAALQRDLQQIARIQSQNRPPVRFQVADLRQLLNQLFGLLPARHIDQMMHLAGPLAAFVDRRNLDLQQEAGGRRAGRRQLFVHRALQFVAQAKQARFRRDQVPLQFGKPLRMRKVAGAQQGDAFAARPEGHVLPGRRPGWWPASTWNGCAGRRRTSATGSFPRNRRVHRAADYPARPKLGKRPNRSRSGSRCRPRRSHAAGRRPPRTLPRSSAPRMVGWTRWAGRRYLAVLTWRA